MYRSKSSYTSAPIRERLLKTVLRVVAAGRLFRLWHCNSRHTITLPFQTVTQATLVLEARNCCRGLGAVCLALTPSCTAFSCKLESTFSTALGTHCFSLPWTEIMWYQPHKWELCKVWWHKFNRSEHLETNRTWQDVFCARFMLWVRWLWWIRSAVAAWTLGLLLGKIPATAVGNSHILESKDVLERLC